MRRFWKEHDVDNKINLKFNRFGQPCGLKTCKLTNFIGTLVKGKEMSLAAQNWSKVPKLEKEKLWGSVQVCQRNLTYIFASSTNKSFSSSTNKLSQLYFIIGFFQH